MLIVANEKLLAIQQEAENQEPITPNFYSASKAIRPETDSDIEYLKDELVTEILTARTMPFFLIQGQRRVGKTAEFFTSVVR